MGKGAGGVPGGDGGGCRVLAGLGHGEAVARGWAGLARLGFGPVGARRVFLKT